MTDWSAHLKDTGRIHFVEMAACNDGQIKDAATSIGYAYFGLDASGVPRKDELLRRLAMAANFPSYFGGTWDGVADLLRDLFWMPAPGYTLLVTAADDLTNIGARDFESMCEIFQLVIADWRDERGEYGERVAPPFM